MANKKLIDTNEAKKKLRAIQKWFVGYPSTEQDQLAQAVVKMCIDEIGKIKPVDAVEVVRCKNCKYCRPPWLEGQKMGRCMLGRTKVVGLDDFCSNGEKIAEECK